MRNSLRIGRLFGIDLRIDSSWILIFVLVIWSLSALFSGWHRDWSPGTTFLVAVLAALLFFASVLFHELAHSLVARAYGVSVRDITLHMFGGVSNIEREPPTPGAEFLIAIVGPISSIALGVAMLFGGALVTGYTGTGTDEVEANQVLSHMGPLGTLLLWLGPINILVGVFNLIPGFPLDGGRILRSILWKSTGDLGRATRWSASVGQAVGWCFVALGLLMVIGVRVPFFGRGLVGGIWLALIGMFLRNAAVQHYVGSAVHDALEGVRSRDLMRTRGAWVEASTPLRVLVDGWFSKTDGDSFPVFDQGRFVGFVSIDGIRTVPVSEWDTRTARDIMVPVERLAVGSPDEPVYEALRRLGAADLRQLPIVENGALVGILNEQDIGRFVDLTAARRGRPAPRPRHA